MLLSKIKKIPKNTNGRLAIPALAGLLVLKLIERVRICLFFSSVYCICSLLVGAPVSSSSSSSSCTIIVRPLSRITTLGVVHTAQGA